MFYFQFLCSSFGCDEGFQEHGQTPLPKNTSSIKEISCGRGDDKKLKRKLSVRGVEILYKKCLLSRPWKSIRVIARY